MPGKRPNIDLHPTAEVSQTAEFQGNGSVFVSAYCVLESGVFLDTGLNPASSIRIGARSKLKKGVVLRTYDGWIDIGKRCSIGEYSVLAGHGGIQLEDAVIVAGHCYFSAAEHIYHSDVHIRFQGETATGIRIGQGAWIGARVTIRDGVEIGERCVVGANSFVADRLPPGMVCFGTPCQPHYKANGRRK